MTQGQADRIELVFLCNVSCWRYLFYVSGGLLKVHQAPLGSGGIGVASG